MNATLLILLSAIPGGGCAKVQNVVVQKQVALQPVVYAPPIIVPLYSFVYAPPVYSAPVYAPTMVQQYVQEAKQQYAPAPMPQPQVAPMPQAIQEEPCDLCQELRKLRYEVARLRGVPVADVPAQPPPIQQPLTGAGIIGQRCAVCHSSTAAPANGGGFVLMDAAGKLSPLSLPEKRRIIELTTTGKMPKAPHTPLSQAEKDSLKLFLEGGSP